MKSREGIKRTRGEDEKENNNVNERRKDETFHRISQRHSYNRVIEQSKLDARDIVCASFHVAVLQVMLCVGVSILRTSAPEGRP